MTMMYHAVHRPVIRDGIYAIIIYRISINKRYTMVCAQVVPMVIDGIFFKNKQTSINNQYIYILL